MSMQETTYSSATLKDLLDLADMLDMGLNNMAGHDSLDDGTIDYLGRSILKAIQEASKNAPGQVILDVLRDCWMDIQEEIRFSEMGHVKKKEMIISFLMVFHSMALMSKLNIEVGETRFGVRPVQEVA